MSGGLRLNCLIFGEGRNGVFPVNIPSTETIGVLTEVIKGKRKHAFNGVDAQILLLWKVHLFINKDLIERHIFPDDDLPPVDELLDVFSEPSAKTHLHIVIKTTPTGEFEIFST